MTLFQIINAVVGYGAVVAILFFLWRIARGSDARTEHMVVMSKSMTDISRANAEAAKSAAESARTCVEATNNLIALLSKEDHSHE